MQNYDLLIERIAKAAGLEVAEVERKVEAKKAKLSGLISKEGAAQIIAAELGINFENLDLKISELMPGMRKVNVSGKIINMFPVREYEKNGKSGKVLNMMLADETGNCRIVLWDTNHIALIEEGKIKADDVVEIRNASMRDTEIHLSSFSEFKKSSKVMDNVKTEKAVKEKGLDEVVNGDSIKVRGLVVQVFDPRFFNVCPECGKKATGVEGVFTCAEHGQVQAKEKAILNFVVDDGKDSIRVVLFSDAINKLVPEMDLKDVEKLIVFKEDFLGSEIYISGNIRKNSLFGNLELIGNDVEKADVEKLIVELEK